MKDDSLYLAHMQECIARVEAYTAGGKSVFLADTKTQDAVLRNLQTLAESTQRLSDEVKAKHLDVDWRGIAAFRNVVVHSYLGISLNQVWDIVEQDLPVLKATIEVILKEQKDE